MTVIPLAPAAGRAASRVDAERIAREHHAALLAVARLHIDDREDAHDAVQRGLEILVRCQHRLRPETALAWLKVVVKHEAIALARAHARERTRHTALEDPQLDAGALHGDELCARIDLRDRARRDLPQLKPQERRALGLLAAGHSYRDISRITGWTYTKINRCVTEGRRRLARLDADHHSPTHAGRVAKAS
jgi:RNA polymerase sigma factor (sigma-70 family)